MAKAQTRNQRNAQPNAAPFSPRRRWEGSLQERDLISRPAMPPAMSRYGCWRPHFISCSLRAPATSTFASPKAGKSSRIHIQVKDHDVQPGELKTVIQEFCRLDSDLPEHLQVLQPRVPIAFRHDPAR